VFSKDEVRAMIRTEVADQVKTELERFNFNFKKPFQSIIGAANKVVDDVQKKVQSDLKTLTSDGGALAFIPKEIRQVGDAVIDQGSAQVNGLIDGVQQQATQQANNLAQSKAGSQMVPKKLAENRIRNAIKARV
jgi:hypothetical protein